VDDLGAVGGDEEHRAHHGWRVLLDDANEHRERIGERGPSGDHLEDPLLALPIRPRFCHTPFPS